MMTTEPLTLLDLALGLMVLMMFIIALVAFIFTMKMFIEEFFGKKDIYKEYIKRESHK